MRDRSLQVGKSYTEYWFIKHNVSLLADEKEVSLEGHKDT
jgi:hypothetical protein